MTEIRALRWIESSAVTIALGGWIALFADAGIPAVRAQSASIAVGTIPSVAPGTTIALNWTVTNTGGSWRTFGVGAEIRQGSTALVDLGQQATSAINSGGTASGEFAYTIPGGWTNGTYTARCAVWTGTPGASIWLNSYDRNFTVEPTALTLSGRIAFHRDSDNHSLHAPASVDDGHVFTLQLDNASVVRRTADLGLGNCLNPHFSPDGARLTFMAIPSGQPLLWANMRIYLLDLAEGSPLVKLGFGQDPKFSADGQRIVFKASDGQLHEINTDGTSGHPITSGGAEKSGPNYPPTPGDERIVYWNTTSAGATRYGDIAWRLPGGIEETLVHGTAERYCYYPVWRDAGRILFTISEGNDNLYEYTTALGSYAALTALNSAADESDPFPAGDLVGFSSTRSANGGGGYDLYLAKSDGSGLQNLAAANSSLHELGGAFSPFTNARKVALLAPANGAQLTAGSSTIFTARLWSNGAVWMGAAPNVVWQGPGGIEFPGLHDDGIDGDLSPGDGIYSLSANLPPQAGSYTVFATADAIDGEMLLQVRSANSTVNLAAVRLDSMRVGKNLILSWPTNVIGFKLESTLALTNSVWSELATAPLIVGDRYTVTNRITEEARFYRLRWP
ncbi:MAG: choice-of-anchor X domain-containing protein [Verrucomicrobiota bacterium]